ncbi:hypothetical protein [Streptomyces sp. ITFR-6]|uniref:hypothetical protein n=1 Tax=Streptomyces sp. ITFR-6 TaxID=3075197 RepID=UPI00288AA7EF|nr:hypothetical protein [Streptomyces sp. ITFR-6]WNI28620.1 hypothetical protein RLT59_07340 [Streptomyces sp. ITFR-6]
MARQMVGDGVDVYRLKVTLSRPNWRGESVEVFGPFNSIGAARGQRTTYAKLDWVSSAQIQSAYTEWSDVQ